LISIIDYNAGNITSVVSAFQFLGAACEIISAPEQIRNASALVLPGVGAFGWAMDELKKRGLEDELRAYIRQDRPFLGICLGLQLLFEGSDESPGVPGLGVFKGSVRRLTGGTPNGETRLPQGKALKIPHIGWNDLQISQPRGLFRNISNGEYFYFVHSYFVKAENRALSAAATEYGDTFDSAVQTGNVAAVQFHPEKSGGAGMDILKNFIALEKT
jgi:glutamine amidotransferase